MTNPLDTCHTITMMIKLTGKTNHGKNRVREHGDLWEVLEVPTGVLSMTHKPPFPPYQISQDRRRAMAR